MTAASLKIIRCRVAEDEVHTEEVSNDAEEVEDGNTDKKEGEQEGSEATNDVNNSQTKKKKKKKSGASKKPVQTNPPSIPIADLFPAGVPEGQIMEHHHDDSMAKDRLVLTTCLGHVCLKKFSKSDFKH